MIFKINSIVLLGIIATTVSARSEYKYETSSGQIANTTSSRNDALLQQLAAGSLRRSESLNNMPLDTESKTEVPLKNVRNISDNKLPNDYTSIDHEATQHMGMWQEVEEDDKNTPSSEEHARIRLNSREEEYGTEIPLSKKNRTSRVFSVVTTTSRTIPQYIRRKEEEKPILTQEDFNVSDYAEDEKIDRIQKHTTNIPFYMNMNNSSEENDEMLPLAMKYYDEISPEHASSTRRIEAVSSEDYYEDEYHEPELSTKTAANVHTPNNNILDFSTFVTTTISTTRTTATTPTQNPLPITFPANIPIIGQFDESLLTTFAPQTALSQLQTTTPGTSSPGAATIADKRGKQIPILSTVPIVTTTTTTTSRRRLLPHEQLRNYIEDAYIRMPLAVIVDPSVESLEKTKSLWNDGLRTNLNIKIVLVTLNESHESPAAFNFNNTRQFLTGLNSIKEHYSGDAFRGISHAAELVPYDSAVYISTAQLAKHTDQVQDSMITLLKKRIKLYLIWFGERSLSENETQDSVGGILGEMAIRSGGEILHLVSSENSQELEDSTLTIVADALRGSQEIDVPVDTTLSSLHVQIDQMMRKAVLETPNGG